ncbi:MAG TPA: alkaline phosphatase family protein [Phycisphaerae bacterium]|nr:alkaline phosphatase family protein [Phycisphaerae bacterium]
MNAFRLLTWTVPAALAAAFAGCGEPGPVRIRLNDDVVRPPRSVLVFFPDGLHRARFDELVAAGQLPHITRRFVQGGIRVDRAVDSLPTVTYANCSSLVTGLFPGHHGIPGNVWLDRQSLESCSYMTLDTYRVVNEHLTVPTLYSILGDHFTLNIQLHTYRGVTRSIDGYHTFRRNWILGFHGAVDRSVPDRLPAVAALANREKRWPSVIMTYFPAVDEVGHRFGPNSPQYDQAVRDLDTAVGRMTDAIDRAGLGDRTYYVLVSDHGMPAVEPDRHLDLSKWLEVRRALNCRETPLQGHGRAAFRAALERYDAFLVIGADRMAAIHLRGRQGWDTTPTCAEVASFIESEPHLAELPAVDCVLARDGTDRVRLWSSRGAAAVERSRDGGQVRYRLLVDRGDPLGYAQPAELAAFVQAGWHTSRDWLRATSGSTHPDFVPQTVEMFDSPRAGDVILFAAQGWDFSLSQKAGHGSCLAGDMLIPLHFAGPGLAPGGTIPCGRLVDVAPTLIGLLGDGERLRQYTLDGVDLSGELRAATSAR